MLRKRERAMRMLQLSLVLLFAASIHQAVAVELINYDPLSTVCSPESNYTANSAYQQNLKSLLRSLSSNITTGFATATAGQSPDKVYGLALCRGDLSAAECQNCVAEATAKIQHTCPISKSSTMWRLGCELRYSSSNFMGTVNTNFFYLTNVNNAADPILFIQQMKALLQHLSATAAANSSSMFASGQIQYNYFQIIYGAVQCTRDLSSANCMNCLNEAMAFIPYWCVERQGAVVIGATCSIRYELYPFLRGSSVGLQLPSPAPSSASGSVLIAVAVVIPLLVLCILIFGLILWRRKSKKPSQIEDSELLDFSLASIRAATNNFSEANKIGEGSFGPVYKGTIDGKEIAVKRLSYKSGQGSAEFKNEVRLIPKLQHRNLVRLLGCCMENQEEILVYEFVPNNTLQKVLFDKRLPLDWAARLKIIKGIARGLLYLHEDSRLKIIHMDLKPSNVLLDNEMNPKISGFGLARICGMDETYGNTSIIAGTYGYMAPEYAINGDYSVKSDVFSFGVLLLEIASGRKITSFDIDADGVEDLLTYAWELARQNRPLEVVDKALGESYDRKGALRCIHIGLLCVQEDMMDRPTMSSVALMLGSTSLTLPAPNPPAFYKDSSSRQEATSSSFSYSGDKAEDQDLQPLLSTSSSAVTIIEMQPR